MSADGWQPIETAPPAPDWKSGEEVFFLVWNGREVLPASRDMHGDIVDITAPDRDGEWLDVSPGPTHWMPLPKPPA